MKSLPRNPLLLLATAGLCVLSLGADDKEQPVGLVRDAGGNKLQRAGMATPLAARNFDFLYPGDRIVTAASPATFIFCPTQESVTLAPASEILFDTRQLKVSRGKVADRKPVGSCLLPQAVR